MSTPDLVALNQEILSEFPSYQVIYKSDSAWMKIVNVLLLIVTFGQMNDYMTDFVTTMGTTVYVPSSWDGWIAAEKCSILRHERIHMRQAKRMTRVLFSLCYILWPLPMFLSWGRTRLEMEAYEETLAAWKDYGIDPRNPLNRASMISNFTSSYYGWMWPFDSKVAAWYDAAVKRIFS